MVEQFRIRRLIVGLTVAALLGGCATEPGRQSPGPTASSPTVMPTAAATPARSPAAMPSPTAAPASPTAMPTLTPVSAPEDGLGTWQVVKGSALVAGNVLAVRAGQRGVLLLQGFDVEALPCGNAERNRKGGPASFYDARTHAITRVSAGAEQHSEVATLPDGRVMLAVATPDEPSRRTRIWAPRSGRWSEGARMITRSDFFDLVPLTDGRVMKIDPYTSTVELYDPGTNRWTPTAPLELTEVDQLGSLTSLSGGRVLALGLNESAALYEPATGLWTTIAPPSFWTDPIPLPDGTVVGFGELYGRESDVWVPFAARFDPSKGSSTVIGHWAPPRDTAAAVLSDGRVFFAGGLFAGGESPDGFTARAWIFDPGTGRVSEIASMPGVRSMASAVALDDGSVLVAGGADLWETEPGSEIPRCVPAKYRVVRWVP